MKYLLDVAQILGVLIKYADLSRRDRDGEYDHERRIIWLQHGMSYRLKRSVLAHELAHAIFGDEPTMFGPVNAKQERRADEWAARTLIRLEDFKAAEAAHNGHVASMANDLDVITDLVEAYQRILARIGDTVYLRPRMGVGQWDHREKVA
ncbi:hypothetical protein GCM10010910_00900 [Microbacterium nanhaiense]|uniref:IrrE N-terminal-like domain-containing protein n=1 Tax=Microbacterium nanhaiense TaxID=1301026 RepID=A0ABQ2MW00_9MICO|nr:ImmA/IrrE family metallo-endopeptidase [Microbacterium nanhaiense]GGO59000.1 hypothetical protein GCM10010910_00900 [Microbacterium nanhaiense]